MERGAPAALWDRQPGHQPRGQGRTAGPVLLDCAEALLQEPPVNRPRQLHQWFMSSRDRNRSCSISKAEKRLEGIRANFANHDIESLDRPNAAPVDTFTDIVDVLSAGRTLLDRAPISVLDCWTWSPNEITAQTLPSAGCEQKGNAINGEALPYRG
jgi:hypothetical protein